jgi:hypothetical protein
MKRRRLTYQAEEPGAQRAPVSREALDLVAEEIAKPRVRPDPQQRAQGVDEQEPGPPHPKDAGERLRHRVQPRHELGDQERPAAVPGEHVLAPAHTGVRLERDPAQQAHHLAPASPPDLVPDDVAEQRGGNAHRDGGREAEQSRAGQHPRCEQDRLARDRQRELLDGHPHEQDDIPVVDQIRSGVIQVSGPARPTG